MRALMLFWLIVLASILPACRVTTELGSKAVAPPPAPPRPARINHLAFFKLKDPADADQLIADCDSMLATIPGVVSYYCGKHLDTGRPTVDDDYHVGFYVGFMTEADYQAYVDHPNHVAGVNKWKPRWEWIRVQDVVDETE